MEPSRFFRQHHAVEAPAIDELEFRPGWRVRPRLDDLLIDNAITYTEWKAAVAFKTLASRFLASVYPSKWLDEPRGGKKGFDGALAARQDVINRLEDIHRRLGSDTIGLLELHIVKDLDWKDLGPRLGVHPRTARKRVILALQALAVVIWR